MQYGFMKNYEYSVTESLLEAALIGSMRRPA
jgi:hypothetical protein